MKRLHLAGLLAMAAALDPDGVSAPVPSSHPRRYPPPATSDPTVQRRECRQSRRRAAREQAKRGGGA